MRVEQFYYTSCLDGLSGSAGFQYRAASVGDRQVMEEIRPLLNYEPPPSAPLVPAPDEIDNFPVALSYLLLGRDRRVICQSRYVGTDYSGRYGNFFAHALYLPDADDEAEERDDVLPIEMWRSRVWDRGEPDTRKLQPLDGLEPGAAITKEATLQFALKRAGCVEAFLADVRQAVDPARRRQIILVDRSSDEVAQWIALASYSLPRRLARQLSFTTYTRRPYHAPHSLVGITDDADFAFSRDELDNQYRVHDHAGGRSSPMPSAGADGWAALAAQLWHEGRVDLFTRFDELAERHDVPIDGDDLWAGLAATAFAHGVALSEPAADAALDWAGRHAGRLPEDFRRLLDPKIAQRVAPVLDRLADAGTQLDRVLVVLGPARHWPDAVNAALTRLEDAARRHDGQLWRAVDGDGDLLAWLDQRDLGSRPHLLAVVCAAAERSRGKTGGELFRAAYAAYPGYSGATGRLEIGLAIVKDLLWACWPDHQPSAEECRAVVETVEPHVLRETTIPQRVALLLRQQPIRSAAAATLAIALDRAECVQQLPTSDRQMVTVTVFAGKLDKAYAGPEDFSMALTTLRHLPSMSKARGELADAVVDYVVDHPGEHLAELIDKGQSPMLHSYVRQCRVLLPGRFRADPLLAVHHFQLWTRLMETTRTNECRRLLDYALSDILASEVRRMSRRDRAKATAEVEKRYPALRDAWREQLEGRQRDRLRRSLPRWSRR